MEDIPDEATCKRKTRPFATRVECFNDPPLSPAVPKSDAKYDYPIVRHHPLFAKNNKGRSGAISSLLVGESVEYMRKPGTGARVLELAVSRNVIDRGETQ